MLKDSEILDHFVNTLKDMDSVSVQNKLFLLKLSFQNTSFG